MSEDAIDMTVLHAGDLGLDWQVRYAVRGVEEWCTVKKIRDFGSRVVVEYTDDTLDTFEKSREVICRKPEEE